MSADRTDELTDEEYEYEFLQDLAYKKIMNEHANNAPINVSDNKFERQFSMDEDVYNHFVELSKTGEYVDFNIPKDAATGKQYSTMNNPVDESENFIPVDMSQLFGGEIDG